jgi:hypothetical protein
LTEFWPEPFGCFYFVRGQNGDNFAMMQTEPSFSWLRPAFFTLFGAALGFVASQVRDWWKAKRDKRAFLRAVGMELDALGAQLDGSLPDVKGAKERVEGKGRTGPQFALALRTSVFATQIGKLSDVDDPLLIDIVHFYSDLGTLERIIESVNETSVEYTRAEAFHGEKDNVRPRLVSSLIEFQNQISIFSKRLRQLRAKLPPAEAPKP